MIEVVVEADEFSRMASNGVHLGKNLAQIGIQHGKGNIGISIGLDLKRKREEDKEKAGEKMNS